MLIVGESGDQVCFSRSAPASKLPRDDDPYELLKVASSWSATASRFLRTSPRNWKVPTAVEQGLPRRILAVPIRSNRLLGVVLLDASGIPSKEDIDSELIDLAKLLAHCIGQCRSMNAIASERDRKEKLARFSYQLAQELRPEKITEIALKYLKSEYGYDACTLYLYSKRSDSWSLLAQEGLNRPINLRAQSHLPESAVVRMMEWFQGRRTRFYVSPRSTSDPLLKGRFAGEEGITTTAVVRLSVQQIFVGIVFLNFRSVKSFSRMERENAEAASRPLSLALLNALQVGHTDRRNRILIAIREVTDELNSSIGDFAMMYRKVVDTAVRVLQAEHAILYTARPEGFNLLAYAGPNESFAQGLMPREQGIGRMALQGNRQIVVENIQLDEREARRVQESVVAAGVDVLACFPILRDAEQQSLLYLLFTQKPDDLTAMSELGRTLANAARIAIANAVELRDASFDAWRRLSELEELSAVQELLAAAASQEDVLGRAFEALLKLTGARQACVARFDEDTQTIRLVKTTALVHPIDSLPVDKCLAGTVIRERRTIVIRNDREMAAYPFAHILNEHSRSCIMTPVFAGNEALGVLDIESPEDEAFAPGLDKTMERLAHVVASALVGVRATEDRARLIVSSPDTDEALFDRRMELARAGMAKVVLDKLNDMRLALEGLSNQLPEETDEAHVANRLVAEIARAAQSLHRVIEWREPGVVVHARTVKSLLDRVLTAQFVDGIRAGGISVHVQDGDVDGTVIHVDEYWISHTLRDLLETGVIALMHRRDARIDVSVLSGESTVVIQVRATAKAYPEVGAPFYGLEHISETIERFLGGRLEMNRDEDGSSFLFRLVLPVVVP